MKVVLTNVASHEFERLFRNAITSRTVEAKNRIWFEIDVDVLDKNLFAYYRKQKRLKVYDEQ